MGVTGSDIGRGEFFILGKVQADAGSSLTMSSWSGWTTLHFLLLHMALIDDPDL